MRRMLPAVLIAVVAIPLSAKTHTNPETKAAPPAQSAASGVITDLPVLKVVLYKNGVGYFEHAGPVSGDQRVAIDFTSSQLNDVLQSLTALDSGGGKVSAVSYNSTTPIEQQLDSLTLGLKEDSDTSTIYEALRGQRVEVTGAGATLTGRLVNVESRSMIDKNGNGSADHYYLIVETDDGALRTAELTDALSVHMLDPSLERQFASYLEIIGSAHSLEGRHLTLEDRGQGQRQLQVSYISEVPVWKSTYRIVFPRDGGADATVQGWAVVDNTVGVDWSNVQLSLVAGAPQSFIQPLSQPIYTRRSEIPIAIAAQTTPQTFEAAESAGAGTISGTVSDVTGAVISGATVTVTSEASNTTVTRSTSSDGSFTISGLAPGVYRLNVSARNFQTYSQRDINVTDETGATVNARLNVGSVAQTVTVESTNREVSAMGMLASKSRGGPLPMSAPYGAAGGLGSGYGYGGGVYRASDAIQQGDVSTNAFDDFFEYAIAQPVTIHKNESAMVPILQQDLPAEHVTVWSARNARPLRAIWLENKSNLTLDSGSFSIFENGEFAGEGLLDPIHPNEKRLLSYAADTAVKVASGVAADTHVMHHVAMHKGVLVETTDEVKSTNYTVTNGADEARTVVVEHLRMNGATLDSDTKPVESTPSIYRFKVAAGPHQSAELRVAERSTIDQQIVIDPDTDHTDLLIETGKFTPQLAAQLKPLIDAETALFALNDKLGENDQKQKTLTDDEARDRDNVTALKGSDAGKRFVDELNQAEDQLQAARKEQADLEQQIAAARAQLESLIGKMSFDADVAGAVPAAN
jgi:Carboxypeptidase regulatory-like domain